MGTIGQPFESVVPGRQADHARDVDAITGGVVRAGGDDTAVARGWPAQDLPGARLGCLLGLEADPEVADEGLVGVGRSLFIRGRVMDLDRSARLVVCGLFAMCTDD